MPASPVFGVGGIVNLVETVKVEQDTGSSECEHCEEKTHDGAQPIRACSLGLSNRQFFERVNSCSRHSLFEI